MTTRTLKSKIMFAFAITTTGLLALAEMAPAPAVKQAAMDAASPPLQVIGKTMDDTGILASEAKAETPKPGFFETWRTELAKEQEKTRQREAAKAAAEAEEARLDALVVAAGEAEKAGKKRALMETSAKAKVAIQAESKVIGVHYDPEFPFIWTIGVKDDGTKRFGLAGYFCQVLAQHGATTDDTMVRIVDYVKLVDGASPRQASLGTVVCRTHERITP